MTQHFLQSHDAQDDAFWFRRRSFLQAAAAWSAMGGLAAAHAQQRSNIVELRGDARINGGRLDTQRSIQTGDSLETGPGSHLVFVIGNSAFEVRPNSRLAVERGPTLNTVSVLRLITGAVASVWGRGTRRQIVMPTLTAGIRGTGVYTEVFPEQGNRSYCCNCYGAVELAAGGDKTLSQSDYHQAFWGEVEPKNGRLLVPAKAINHNDAEIEFLARLVNQRTAWQISGRKGSSDGGYSDHAPQAK
jgi:hypothetical protein